jgi:hypothetical protein
MTDTEPQLSELEQLEAILCTEIHPVIIEAIVYPDTLSPELRQACDEANATPHDREEVQRFASVPRALRTRERKTP